MPESALTRYFPHVPEALTNTRVIAEQCCTDWDFKDTIFPSFRQLSTDAAFQMLRTQTYDGALWRYGGLPEVVKYRIEQELTVIREKGYADYFLVVDEIVRQAPRTCGRGSAAASIVSYCLGITHVDPIRHNLLFERFLHPGRHDPPDIDIDFPWDERPKILDWVFNVSRSQGAGRVFELLRALASGSIDGPEPPSAPLPYRRKNPRERRGIRAVDCPLPARSIG